MNKEKHKREKNNYLLIKKKFFYNDYYIFHLFLLTVLINRIEENFA